MMLPLVIIEIVFLLIAKVVAAANPVSPDFNPFELAFQADSLHICPPGYSQPSNSNFTSCYKVYADFNTKRDAVNQCKLSNGTLASVPNDYVNSYLYYLASQVDATSIWLGSECFNGDRSTCMNDDGTPFVYNNFKPGQPDALENCMYMSAVGKDSQKWSTFDCEQRFAYACEVDAVPFGMSKSATREPISADPPTCPQNYTEFQGICYRLVIVSDVWTGAISGYNASDACRLISGGNLASVPNKQVNDFLSGMVKNVTTVGTYTTVFGLMCPYVKFSGDMSSCTWSDGTPFAYNNFGQGRPPGGDNGCCDFSSGSWMNCFYCYEKIFNAYICQAPKQ